MHPHGIETSPEADSDVVVEIYDRAFCDDRLLPSTLATALGFFSVMAAAPLIYTRRSVDLINLLIFVPVVLLAIQSRFHLREIAFRQLVARFLFGWCIVLPIIFVVCGFVVAFIGNFIYVATMLPMVVEQAVELTLWVALFSFVAAAEETLKSKADNEQHFEALPPFRVYSGLGFGTSLGHGAGTSYYLCFLARYWTEKRCGDTPLCNATPSFQIGIVIIAVLFAQAGQLLGWYYHALTHWHWITKQNGNREEWNPKFRHLVFLRGAYSGVIVFSVRHIGLWTIGVAVLAMVTFMFYLRLTARRLMLN